MEKHVRQILRNWINIKGKIPKENEDKDPLYIDKLNLLYRGYESLGDKTYLEWSEDVETRLASMFEGSAHNPFSEYTNSLRILADSFLISESTEPSTLAFGKVPADHKLYETCQLAYLPIVYVNDE